MLRTYVSPNTIMQSFPAKQGAPRAGFERFRWLCALFGFVSLAWSSRAAASEANLVLPDLSSVPLLRQIDGRALLIWGIAVCILGLLFGLWQFTTLKRLPVHRAMLEISELIYATCKTYLITQGKFILILEACIGTIMVVYFGVLRHLPASTVGLILLFSLIGIAGSYGVAWFGIRVNTFANSRTAFASLRGKPFPTYEIPLRAGMSIGMMLISTELLIMLIILLFVPGNLAGPCSGNDAEYRGLRRVLHGRQHLHAAPHGLAARDRSKPGQQ